MHKLNTTGLISAGLLILGALTTISSIAYADRPVAAAMASQPAHEPMVFGLLMVTPSLNLDQRIGIAHELGVPHIRSIASSTTMQKNDALFQYQKAGFSISLNIIDSVDADKVPTKGVKDIARYKRNVATIIDTYHPNLVVIENEENNPQFYVGTAEQYIAELEAAIDVVHQKGLKVADGGLLQAPVAYLAWKQLWDTGKRAQADTFAQQAFPYGRKIGQDLLGSLPTQAHPNKKPLLTKEMAHSVALTEKVLAAFKKMNLDYVNLHWYESDAKATPAVATIVAFMREATGKPVITNEFGQLDKSAATVASLLQGVYGLKLPYAVWADMDGVGASPAGGGQKAYALQEPTGALRPNGVAFKQFMLTNVSPANKTVRP